MKGNQKSQWAGLPILRDMNEGGEEWDRKCRREASVYLSREGLLWEDLQRHLQPEVSHPSACKNFHGRLVRSLTHVSIA